MTKPSLPQKRQRILAAYLPYLPAERLRRAQRIETARRVEPGAPREEAIDVNRPLVFVARQKNAIRIAATDAAAASRGIHPGQTLADARALLPGLVVHEADPEADHTFLNRLADWALRFTPLVGLDRPDGLLLDITGCAHLFGGEAALAEDLANRLKRQGLTAHLGLADTVGAAWAIARFAAKREDEATILIPPGAQKQALTPLPPAALRLDDQTVDTLRRLGLTRIGQLLGQPRGPLTARFGPALFARLDQALGHSGEAITPRQAVPMAMAERRFAEPIAHQDAIEAVIATLAVSLSQTLERRGAGARILDLALFRVDGHVEALSVGTSRPLRTPKRIIRLFAERIAGLARDFDAGYGYDLVRLSARNTETLAARQTGTPGLALGDDDDVGDLIDRLGARLGSRQVTITARRDSHWPERVDVPQTAVLALDADPGWSAEPAPRPEHPPERPARLLPVPEPIEAIAEIPDGPPAQIVWRRVSRRIRRAEGPERIAAEWWHADGPTRDYFRIEDDTGHRYWVFRQGLYGRETDTPRWFMHGLFA